MLSSLDSVSREEMFWKLVADGVPSLKIIRLKCVTRVSSEKNEMMVGYCHNLCRVDNDTVNRCLSDFDSGGNLVQLRLKKPGKTIYSK